MALPNTPLESRHTRTQDSNSTTDLATNLFGRVLLNARTVNSYGENIESSTIESENSRLLVAQATSIFTNAKEEIFEDGMESEFSRNLSDFILSFGQPAMEVIIDLYFSNSVNTEVVSESLRILGRLRHRNTYRERLWLLERCLLYSPFARIRDGALLGLSFLNDKLGIPPLKSAIEKESILELRHDMERVLTQLEGVKDGVSTKKDSKE
ncbi:MAG: hypothetical protein Q8L41_04055 [Anaerolineales bacterium]|nr:hypothetical protein [Anaerolineales bacterium]